MLQKIAIKYCKGIVINQSEQELDMGRSLSFISEMMAYGYMPNEELADALSELSKTDITSLYNEVLPILKKSVGANVKHKPFYPNFPEQVMNASDISLYISAMSHYFTKGKWIPNFTVADRPVAFENTKFKTLSLVTEAEVNDVFTTILSSNDSISDSSKEVIKWFVEQDRTFNIPVMPFKENACLLAGLFLENDMWDSRIVKDTTDVLRIATYLSGGDISLAENTKFKSFSRPTRRLLVKALENVAREEDFVRHGKKWVKLFHSLHVGDYSKSIFEMAKKLRENIKIETFNGKFEEAMQCGDMVAATALAKTRPGIFARNMGRMLAATSLSDRQTVIRTFAEVVDQVPARNLTQLWGSFKTRTEDVEKRVVFPKGSIAKAYVLRNELARLPAPTVQAVISTITDSLDRRFKGGEQLGNVFIDPAMYECPLPTGMRSASEGLKEVARGTRMPMGDKDALRFFVYWKGNDIDLSASFHDENFKLVEHISYTHLKSADIQAYHSGDITSAHNGASEFVDINIKEALASSKKIRYVVMNVLSYSGEKFSEIDTCFAGWMTRDKVKSNEIFEPKTVEQKVDLNGEAVVTIPAVFDLKERKVIWTDITTSNRSGFNFGGRWGTSGNNVENNRASIEETVEAFTTLDNKVSLGELFEIHAIARGKIVEDKDDADFVFSFGGDVTPYDIETINSEYLTGSIVEVEKDINADTKITII